MLPATPDSGDVRLLGLSDRRALGDDLDGVGAHAGKSAARITAARAGSHGFRSTVADWLTPGCVYRCAMNARQAEVSPVTAQSRSATTEASPVARVASPPAGDHGSVTGIENSR